MRAWYFALLLALLQTLAAEAVLLRPSVILSGAFVQGPRLPSASARQSNALVRLMTPIAQDIGASCLALGGTFAWLQIWVSLAKAGRVDPKLSRKIIHTGSAPLFMLLWPLYSDSPSARYFAAGVVSVQVLRLVLAGLRRDRRDSSNGERNAAAEAKQVEVSSSSDATSELVTAISRSGSSKEALGGPLIYTIVLLLNTAIFFRESPVGVVSTLQMAAGDGLADIVGRKFGTNKWPFAPSKSYVGSLAFVAGAFACSAALLGLFHATGFMAFDVTQHLPQLLLVSVICATVELLPLGDDNITVPLAGLVASRLLLISG